MELLFFKVPVELAASLLILELQASVLVLDHFLEYGTNKTHKG
jgi:hypothetical protein